MIAARLRRMIGAMLERGAGPPFPTGAWAALARDGLATRTPSPGGVLVVSVVGATLGGSWKTPVAIALASALSARGLRTGFVAHSYGSSLRSARVVHADDRPSDVGDEAWLAARSLPTIPVIAGHDRMSAIHLAARAADVIVVDGRGPAWPSTLTVLALDGARPWGSQRLPPRGDLRAPVERFLTTSRWVVAVHDVLDGRADAAAFDVIAPTFPTDARVALVTALARPDRVLAALGRRGVAVVHHVEAPDHGGPGVARLVAAGLRGIAFDHLVATEKCAASLPRTIAGRTITTLGLTLELPPRVVDEVAADARRIGTSARLGSALRWRPCCLAVPAS